MILATGIKRQKALFIDVPCVFLLFHELQQVACLIVWRKVLWSYVYFRLPYIVCSRGSHPTVGLVVFPPCSPPPTPPPVPTRTIYQSVLMLCYPTWSRPPSRAISSTTCKYVHPWHDVLRAISTNPNGEGYGLGVCYSAVLHTGGFTPLPRLPFLTRTSLQFLHGLPQTAAEGTNTFGQANSVYPVLGTYEEGGVIEMKMIISTYHWVSTYTWLSFTTENKFCFV